MKKTLTYLLCLGLLLLFGCAQPEINDPLPHTVSGQVFSDQGDLLPEVMVNSVVDTVFTDAAGRYSVQAHPQGVLEFSKPGFEKWVETVSNRSSLDVTLLEIPSGAATQYDVLFEKYACTPGDSLDMVVVEVKDFGQGTGTTVWTNDKIWVLRNRVFVNAGQTLTIQPGTVVKAATGQGTSAAMLVVARGGRLLAEGTAELPIIFTSRADPLVRYPDGSLCQPTNLTPDDRGLWGGVVILGQSSTNVAGGETSLPGLTDSSGRLLYGGTNDADDSGTLRFVSIRHAGTPLLLGEATGGLTLAGVGSSTTVEQVETFATHDHGIAFYGGTVDTRRLVAAFPAGAAFRCRQGWQGRNQFWLGWQQGQTGPAASHGGGSANSGAAFGTPVIFNATYHGPGPDAAPLATVFAENAGGRYFNSIVVNFGAGAEVEFTGENHVDSYARFQAGELAFGQNIFHPTTADPVLVLHNASPLPDGDEVVSNAAQALTDHFADRQNLQADPLLGADLVPDGSGPAAQSGVGPADSFFAATNYRGCFQPGSARWLDGWSRLAAEL